MSGRARGRYTALGYAVPSGYQSAREVRERGTPPPSGGSADKHARFDRETLLRESQRLDRDNGLYKGLLNRSIDNILGTGFGFQSRSKQAEKVEALWCRRAPADNGQGRIVGGFCAAPEVRNLFDWPALERVVLRAVMVDGDIGAVKIKGGAGDGRLQLIEAERITHNRHSTGKGEDKAYIDQGVKLDDLGQVLAFYVAAYSRWGDVRRSSFTEYSAQNFIFVPNLERASQTRGLPCMASNFPMFHRLNDILDAEAVAWQLLARFALAVYRDEAAQQAKLESAEDANKTEAQQVPNRYQEFDWGIIFHGNLGEKIESVKHDLPGANFEQSVTMFLRLLGLPLGLPLELILLDWSKTNYSSARAALEQAYRMFTGWQQLLIRRFHRPVFEWQVRRWIEDGKLKDADDVYDHEWITPEFPWLDQLKEAMAWGVRLDRGLTTHAQALKSVNRDRGEWLRAREAEVSEAIKLAQKLEKKTGVKVDWTIFAGYDPKGAKATAEALAKIQSTEAAGEDAPPAAGADKPE